MADFGNRVDGTPKGNGYFGVLKRPDGGVSTEISVGFDYGKGEVEVPLLVPTMTKHEIDHILAGKKPTKEMLDKAAKFGMYRIKAGLSPFATPEEEGTYRVPKE